MEMHIVCLQDMLRVCGTLGKYFCGALAYVNNLIIRFIQNIRAHVRHRDLLLRL